MIFCVGMIEITVHTHAPAAEDRRQRMEYFNFCSLEDRRRKRRAVPVKFMLGTHALGCPGEWRRRQEAEEKGCEIHLDPVLFRNDDLPQWSNGLVALATAQQVAK